MKEKRFVVIVDEDDHRKTKMKAVEVDRTVSDIIRKLLRMWLEGEITIKDDIE